MRPMLCLCAATALLSGGCAALIAHSGTDPGRAATRAQVRQTFGEPAATGGADGEPYEDFCCHAKVAENLRASVLLLTSYYSLGLADLYYVPCEVGRVGWKALRGYDLRFYYDADGRVTKYTIDGVPGMPWPLDGLPPSPPSAVPSARGDGTP
jgi:hypothetical protein